MTNETLIFAMSSEETALAAFRALRQSGAKASLGRIPGGTQWHRLSVTVTDDKADAVVRVVLGIDPEARQRAG